MAECTQNDNKKGQFYQTGPPAGQKSYRGLLAVFLGFIVFFLIVFLTQEKEPINWIEDYQAGMELAKSQGKPALICFFKKHTHFSSEMWQRVYSNPELKKYIEANLIPILIDVDKQPQIAKQYNVAYFPTHYIEYPDKNKTDGPYLGANKLRAFIEQAGKNHRQ